MPAHWVHRLTESPKISPFTAIEDMLRALVLICFHLQVVESSAAKLCTEGDRLTIDLFLGTRRVGLHKCVTLLKEPTGTVWDSKLVGAVEQGNMPSDTVLNYGKHEN